MDRPSPATPSAPPAHGGVMYVGPSLTRSLFGVVVALSRGAAQ
jgi:hypothetical protein